jgi:predicted component of type VI protein secretion system
MDAALQNAVKNRRIRVNLAFSIVIYNVLHYLKVLKEEDN